MVASPNEEIFERRLSDFQLKYAEKHLEKFRCIKTYRFDPYKERIVKAWVDEHLHFGNVATSR